MEDVKLYKWIPENVLSKLMYSSFKYRHNKGGDWYILVAYKKGKIYNRPYIICDVQNYEIAWNIILKTSSYGLCQVYTDNYCPKDIMYHVPKDKQIEFIRVEEDYDL